MNTIAKPPPPLRDNTPPVPPTNPVSQPNRVPPSNPVAPANPISNSVPAMAHSVSHWAYGENNALTPARQHSAAIDFAVDHTLHYRKIFALLWTNPSDATNYFVKCTIQLWRGGTKVGELPLCEAVSPAAGSKLGESVASLTANGNGTPTKDSMGLYLSNRTGTQSQAYVLNPQCIYGEIDRIVVSVDSFANMTDLRLWCGCLSSKQ